VTTTDLAPGFAALKEAVMDRYDLSEPLTLEDAAQLLYEVLDLARDFSLIRSGLEEQLIARMETDEVRTNVGTLRRSRKPVAPKWRGQQVAVAVVDRIPPTNEDGEPLPAFDYGRAVMEELIATSGIDNASHKWRKEALRGRGIDPADYRSAESWKTEVRFV
jgi:hypothetical protein